MTLHKKYFTFGSVQLFDIKMCFDICPCISLLSSHEGRWGYFAWFLTLSTVQFFGFYIYEISLALTLFTLIVFLISLDSRSTRFLEGMWCFKTALFLSFFAVLWYYQPATLFRYYLHIAEYVSFIWLLYQAVIFIDFSIFWNTSWLEKYYFSEQADEENSAPMTTLLVFSAVVWIVCGTLTGFSVGWFALGDNIWGTV